jgi:hypothetical protein
VDRIATLPLTALVRLSTYSQLALCLLICASACGSADSAQPDAAADGGAPLDGSSAPSDAGAPEDSGAADDASPFAISLSTTGCRDRCPIFDLKLNQAGAVEFNGRGNTRQQGWGAKTVSRETAAEVLDAVVATNYWELDDVYMEQTDGCAEVEPEQATYTWSVRTDGPTKIVIDYQGCKGVPEVEPLRKIPELLIDKLALELWLGF